MSRTAVAIVDAIGRGELGAREAIEACLDRIDTLEPVVRAWTVVDRDAVAQGAPSLPLYGVAVGVKDQFDTEGLPTSYGSRIYAGHRPTRDAACVRRLREAGAAVLGKTVTTEFSTWTPGPTTNPHDPTRTPGGSSSGSAAAVGAGMVPVAIGSQTVGSTIRPAAFCGIFGMKPTYGLVDLEGAKAMSAPLDTIGLFARDPADLDLVLGVLARPDVLDDAETDLPPRPRVALVRTSFWEQADVSGRQAIEIAAERMDRAGALVEEMELPIDFGSLLDAQMTIVQHDAAQSLLSEYQAHRDALSDQLLTIIENGLRIDEDRYAAALAVGVQARSEIAPVLRRYDFLLTPGVGGEAPVGIDSTGDASFCQTWTLIGAPAVSVPGLTGENGLPVGIQLIGRPRADRLLLQAAAWVAGCLVESGQVAELESSR